jgi:RimJ/RimL family protein N-acetyltransferase
MTVAESTRTRVRRITAEDYDEMFEVYSDLELMKYVGDSTAISPEDCLRWLHITLDNYTTKSYGLFLIEEINSTTCMGFVGLTHPGGIPHPEIKYTLKKEFWGIGIATEVVQTLTQFALMTGWTTRVVATVSPDHIGSQRVLEKAGFVREADICNEDGTTTAYYSCENPVRSPGPNSSQRM